MKVIKRALAGSFRRLSPFSITVIDLLCLLAVATADSICPDRMSFTLAYD
jgi:hypothetical protein